MYVNLEPFLRFSFEYRNTKTKVITTANQKTHKNVLQRNNRNHVKQNQAREIQRQSIHNSQSEEASVRTPKSQ